MVNDDIKKIVVKVIFSWQVLTVTIVLIVYFFLVNYVARVSRRPRGRPLIPGPKNAAAEAPVSSGTDELGLEETPAEKKK